jgi:hypothetical protein
MIDREEENQERSAAGDVCALIIRDAPNRIRITSLERELVRTDTHLVFAVYPEDKTLRLFKKGSMLSEETAGYADEEVMVKVLVKRRKEQFLVCIPARRSELDAPGALERLGWAAYNHRHGN